MQNQANWSGLKTTVQLMPSIIKLFNIWTQQQMELKQEINHFIAIPFQVVSIVDMKCYTQIICIPL